MIGGCSVCLDDSGSQDNQLVYCDGCEVAVHQACYGILNVPAGNWFCRKCESHQPKSEIKCVLCPLEEGALKQTEQGTWAHVVCALYIPEIKFGNNDSMEPIEIGHVHRERYNKQCYLCEERKPSTKLDGAVMDCHKLGCKQSFHVTCAQAAGLLCEEAGLGSSDDLIYCGYCKHHFRKLKADNRNTGNKTPFNSNTNNNLNSSSPYSDSASDSSQDNDLTCNTAAAAANLTQPPRLQMATTTTAGLVVEHDKNNRSESGKSQNTMNTASIPKPDPMIASVPTQLSTIAVSASAARDNLNNKDSTLTNADAIDKTLQLSASSSSNSIGKKTAITKQKTPQADNPSSSATQSDSVQPNNLITSVGQSNSLSPNNDPTKQDVYKWSGDETHTTQNDKNQALNNNNLNNNLGTSRRKQPTGTVTKTSSPQSSKDNQAKLNSPNLLSSPSLVSPSNSIKSSVSTTSATSSSSTSSTASASTSSSSTSSSSSAAQAKLSLDDLSKTNTNYNTQPTVPPLIIPVPHLASSSSLADTQKTSSKAKTPRSSKKKPTNSPQEPIQANLAPKASPKPKPSRLKKTIPAPVTATPGPDAPSPVKSSSTKRSRAKPASVARKSEDGPAAMASQPSQIAVPPVVPTAPVGPTKRKSRSASIESNPTPVAAPSPAKRSRKKKTEPPTIPVCERGPAVPSSASNNLMMHPAPSSNLLSTAPASNLPYGPPLMINTPVISTRLGVPSLGMSDGVPDVYNRYHSPMISPYTTNPTVPMDYLSGPAMPRANLSKLFTYTSSDSFHAHQDDPAKAFEELREQTWSQLSRYILEQAQQFDIPSLIGTLYTLRSENDRLVNRVRELTMKRDQMIAMNARLDMQPQMLTQHLSNTSPGFSSVVSNLTGSPKNMPAPSPGSGIGKQPLTSLGPFNHVPPPGSIVGAGSPAYLDRSSPLVSQTHSGISNVKSSISTPSPPIGALMVHNNSNRAGLIRVNTPYMPSVYPNANTLAPISGGPNQAGSSHYHLNK